MVTHPLFSFANADFYQSLAFVVGAAFTVGFFVWVAYLAWK